MFTDGEGVGWLWLGSVPFRVRWRIWGLNFWKARGAGGGGVVQGLPDRLKAELHTKLWGLG